jgi:hypothetical protein
LTGDASGSRRGCPRRLPSAGPPGRNAPG